ncbi:MAG: RNA polymerase sigma factor [Clostridia bacterium]|nr:RNA polymerase sigma factor [Clostridia bacterium]
MFIFLVLTDGESRDKTVEELLQKIGIGDKNALARLYELVSGDVYAYALSKLGNAADAEDVLQDSFVKIYRYASRYEAQGKPMAWIFTIAANTAKRQRELKARHISYDDALDANEPKEPSAEESSIRNEFIRELLASLSEGEREIVVMHAMWGFKHREIAKHLGMPLATVLSKYNRAIKKLRELC